MIKHILYNKMNTIALFHIIGLNMVAEATEEEGATKPG